MATRTTIPLDSKTVGIDLGDKFSHYCVLAHDGDLVEEGRVKTTPEGFTSHFRGLPKMRIALETGTHSAWVSQLLSSFGHEVIVANAAQIHDAENLACFARFDPKLLHPIIHRDKNKQLDLTVIRLRARLVEVRTTLINSVQSTVKGFGARLPRCVADSFANRVQESLPAEVRELLQPLLVLIGETTVRIKAYDRDIEEVTRKRYPEAAILRTVPGVGPIASLTFVLTIGDQSRFAASRDVGAYRIRRFLGADVAGATAAPSEARGLASRFTGPCSASIALDRRSRSAISNNLFGLHLWIETFDALLAQYPSNISSSRCSRAITWSLP